MALILLSNIDDIFSNFSTFCLERMNFMADFSWQDTYDQKKRSAAEAVRMIKPGQRVFIGSACGVPQTLVKELFLATRFLADVELVHQLSMETVPLSFMADASLDQLFAIRSFYIGSGRHPGIARNMRGITPINLSSVPKLFKTRRLPIHAALVQTSPPDAEGWLSLGISVDITLAAALSADMVMAQVNRNMPHTLGNSRIHLKDIDVIVEKDEPLLTIMDAPEAPFAQSVAACVSEFIEDGSTLQIGLGTVHKTVLRSLSTKNDLGVHTQYMTDELMELIRKGVVTNTRKEINPGRTVASGALGSSDLYSFLDGNEQIEFYPSDYVNDPDIIARHAKMVSVNMATAMDITGQVVTDALPMNHFSGVSGMTGFIRGALKAEDGKSVILLPSTSNDGKESNILPDLGNAPVVVLRSDVHYVVTEFGAVNLFGKSLQERAVAMISIAHPDFRESLFQQARDRGCIGPGRRFRKAIMGVYPPAMEERVWVDTHAVRIRPAKPVDLRRIQEFFYAMDKADVISRFFHERRIFSSSAMEDVSQIDYQKDMTLVALVGEFGFGKVVGMAEYFLNETSNMAEVSVAVANDFKRRGVGSILLKKLSEAACRREITGFLAFTSHQNKAMMNLFKTLPYQVHTKVEDDMMVLTCRFDERGQEY
jgi:acyl-CoA hydrolase/L-amino acid N-acyltransferase YncA